MADQVSVFNEIDFEFAFVDGDTRTQSFKNPSDNITVAQITELNQFLQANNALIGDKVGATFGRVKKVVRRRGTKTKLDI